MVLLQWGVTSKKGTHSITLPYSYASYYSVLYGTINSHSVYVASTYEQGDDGYKTLSTFNIGYTSTGGGSCAGAYWFTIGY